MRAAIGVRVDVSVPDAQSAIRGRIGEPLAAAGRLDARRSGWIPQIEAQIAALGKE